MGRIDLTGRRFGRLVVIGEAPERHRTPGGQTIRQWVCQCDCGRRVTLLQGNLTKSHPQQSCGCGWGNGPRGARRDMVTAAQASADIAANADDKKPGWKLIGPGGEIIYTDNLSRFCRDMGLGKNAAKALSGAWSHLTKAGSGSKGVTIEGWRVLARNPCKRRNVTPRDKGYTGINWHKARNKWQVTYCGKYIGVYSTLEAAQDALAAAKSK